MVPCHIPHRRYLSEFLIFKVYFTLVKYCQGRNTLYILCDCKIHFVFGAIYFTPDNVSPYFSSKSYCYQCLVKLENWLITALQQ